MHDVQLYDELKHKKFSCENGKNTISRTLDRTRGIKWIEKKNRMKNWIETIIHSSINYENNSTVV